MTRTDALRLDYQTNPHDNLPPAAKAIETLVTVFIDLDTYSDPKLDRPLDVIRLSFRPDLTAAQIYEHVETLCHLSAEAASWQNQLGRPLVTSFDDEDASRSPSLAFYAAVDAYVAWLIRFAARPSDFDRHAAQAVAIVDELAARRGGGI